MSPSTVRPVIFLAFANDQDDRVSYLRNLPEEARKLREPIQRVRRDELCEYVELANASAADIFRVFQDPEYRDRIAVFHYGGHANGYELLLESSDGQVAAANAGGFAEFLGQQKGLQLVFLNGCSTQNQVTGLKEADVPAIIATSRAIDDNVAMKFSRQFYQGLAGGASIRTSYNEAAASVKTTQGSSTRSLYLKGENQQKQNDADMDRLPWDLYLKEGAEIVADWNLPMAVGDPLFGLPPLPFNELPESPFRHLSWFDAEHADVFFGRGHQTRDLYEMLTRPDSTPIVLLYGQSGVGKSSLLSAGLIPRLKEEHEVRYVRRDQELGLLGSVKQVLAEDNFDAEDVGEKSIHIGDDWADAEETSSKPLVLIVDQLEECFTRPNPELPQELDEFLNEIDAILGQSERRPQGRLILGFRKEWLAEIELRLQDRRLARTKVFLERLGRRGIIEAVLGPATSERLRNQYGLTVEPGLADMIADDLLDDAGSAIAPTLQILLTKMWDRAIAQDRSNPCFDRELYSRLQKEGILLQDFLEQQFRELRLWEPDVVDSGLVLDLLSMHTTSLGTSAKRDAEELPESYPHRADVLDSLVQKCKDLYLLVDPSRDQNSTDKGTRLSHDTLAPLIRAKFEESDKPGQRARRILDNRVADWKDDHEGTPLDNLDLQVVEFGQAGSRAFNETEQRLLKVSRKERAKRIRAQRLVKFTIGAAILVIFALVSTLAVTQRMARRNLARESSDIVNSYFTTVSDSPLLKQPGLKPLRRELLKKSGTFYSQLIKHHEVTAGRMAVAKLNLGRLKIELEEDHEKALVLFNDAKAIQRKLLDKTPKDQRLRYEYSNTLTQIGNCSAVDPADQKKAYEEALDYRKKLVEEVTPTNENYRDWVENSRKYAGAKMNLANFDLEALWDKFDENGLGEIEDIHERSGKSEEVFDEQDFSKIENQLLEVKKVLESARTELNNRVDVDSTSGEPIGEEDELIISLRQTTGNYFSSRKNLYKLRDTCFLDDEQVVSKIREYADAAITEFEFVLKHHRNDQEVVVQLADCYGPGGLGMYPERPLDGMKWFSKCRDILKFGLFDPESASYQKSLENCYIDWEGVLFELIDNTEGNERYQARLKLVEVYDDWSKDFPDERTSLLESANEQLDAIVNENSDSTEANQLLTALREADELMEKAEAKLKAFTETSKLSARMAAELKKAKKAEADSGQPDSKEEVKTKEDQNKEPGDLR